MPSLSLEEQTNEIMVLHNLVKDNFGYEMKLFRFPEGSTSEQSLGLVESLGYQSVFWSFHYLDYNSDAQKDPAEALQPGEAEGRGDGGMGSHVTGGTNIWYTHAPTLSGAGAAKAVTMPRCKTPPKPRRSTPLPR